MSRRAPSGMTLLELLVGLALSSIVMAGVLAVFLGVQRGYQNEAQVLGAVQGGRTAVAYLEQTLELAGYGVPPADAFDFTAPPGFAKDNAEDTAVRFVTDDLAFRYRDPGFLRRGTFSGGVLTLVEPVDGSTATPSFGVSLPAGTALLIACHGATRHVFVRAPAALGATTTGATLSVERLGPGTAVTDACFTQTGPRAPYVFRVHERRLRIVPLEGRPYLVVFHNLAAPDPAVNTAWEPLAADVESFQVAYQLNRPPVTSKCCAAAAPPDATGNGNWVVGDAAGEALPSAAITGPRYADEYDHASRFVNNPANVRVVRASLVLRSRRADRRQDRAVFEPIAVENAPKPPPGTRDGFYRYVVQTAVRTPNLASRAFFLPPLRTGPAAPGELNVSGG